MLLCAGVVVGVLGVLWVTVPRFVVGGVGGGVSRGGVGVFGVGAGWPACWCSVVPGVPFVVGVWPACGPGGVGCPWCWDIPFGCPWVCSDMCCFGCGLG